MAIKGKKKSQTRGSQARRRPAEAPRPGVGPRRLPWYRTDRGRIWAGVVVALLAGVGWWAVDRQQERAQSVELTQEALRAYTSEARALLQTTRPGAEGLAAVPAEPDAAQRDALDQELQGWISALRRAKLDAGRTIPGPVVLHAHQLFGRAIDLYLLSAQTLRTALNVPAGTRGALFLRAGEARDSAGAIWSTATQVLDRERARAELGPSGLGLPATPSAQTGLPAGGEGGGGG